MFGVRGYGAYTYQTQTAVGWTDPDPLFHVLLSPVPLCSYMKPEGAVMRGVAPDAMHPTTYDTSYKL